MSKTTTTLLALGVALVLFFAVNVLATTTLRSMRVDLTEDDLFTLTDGSLNVARAVDEPVRLKLFVSRESVGRYPQLATYAQRVREMLEEFAAVSGGAIELEVIDPEPYSDAESEAVEAGLPSVPTGDGLERIYLGLVASNAVGDTEMIRFFDPGQERFLEYEVSRLIHTLANPEKTVVGVLSSLPLSGGPMNPMDPRGGAQRWPILGYLESIFETRALEDGLKAIPEDVDVLLLAHPKDLSDATRYAIDQFVLSGKKAIVCVDPWCEADPSGADPSNPFGGMNADKASALPDLLAAWGVELAPARIAADREHALTVYQQSAGGQQAWPKIDWLGLTKECFDEDDVVTSNLAQVRLASAGLLSATAGATTTLSPLIRTGEDSMDLDRGAIQFMSDPKSLLASFVPRGERFVLAARVTGPAQTAFPDGAPAAVPENGDAPEEVDADAEHTVEGEIHVIVIADADFLHERFWLEQDYLFGARKTADNGDLLINAIENLAGGDDLIAIRGRGGYARPFDRVEAIRRDAEERYLSEERALEAQVRAAEDRINELLAQQDPKNMILTPEIEAELDQARATMAETNRQLREVQYMLGKDIKRLGNRLKWINIGLLPALIAVGAIALGTAHKRRRTQRP